MERWRESLIGLDSHPRGEWVRYQDVRKMREQRDELLEALKRSLDWLASYPGDGAENAYEQARAAINKAEGR